MAGRRAGTKNGMGQKDLARRKESQRLMTTVGLWAHLHNLVDEAFAGNREAVFEFQEFIQYAPPEWKDKILDHVDSHLPSRSENA